MATRTAEARHQADRMPSEDEEAAAEASTSDLEESGEEERVARHYQEMGELGAEQQGEGRIE